MITKREYKAIAEILNGEREYFRGPIVAVTKALADHFFASGNPHFDREKFLEEAGVKD